jgi:cell division transport system permease protein
LANSKGGTHFYAIIGIALVLLVLGIAGALGIEAQKLSTDFKENLTVEVVIKDKVELTDISKLQASIKGQPYVKNIKFVSKDDAAKMLKEYYKGDEDFLDILEYNPLYNSFIINLYERYTVADSIEMIRTRITAMEGIQQVNVQKDVLESLNKSVGKASLVILIVAALLLAFAISLIFNTIRLAMFSKRFTIKTMQLFGATRWFIIKPFLGRSIVNGFISGIIAGVLLTGIVGYFDYSMPELALKNDLITFALLLGALVLFGIFISFVSTLTAVLRYLRIKVEDLY